MTLAPNIRPDLTPSPNAAPTQPPSSVKVTLIEDNTALVSWKLPDLENMAVTHYTILYASRKAWVAGQWQVLQRDGERRQQSQRQRGLVQKESLGRSL